MDDEIKDIRGYYKWVQKCKAEFAALNEAWTTTKQKFADEWWAIHERRENKGLVLPKDVEADRRRNDDLHKVEQRLEMIEQNTRHIPGVVKSLRNMFSSFVGDYDTHVEPKTQPKKK